MLQLKQILLISFVENHKFKTKRSSETRDESLGHGCPHFSTKCYLKTLPQSLLYYSTNKTPSTQLQTCLYIFLSTLMDAAATNKLKISNLSK